MRESPTETEYARSHRDLKSRFVKVDFVNCPVETSMGILGKKWTLAILRDVGAYGVDRFSRLRKSLPGIPSKVLATRLKQLEGEGFLRRTTERATPPKVVRWSLTEKGVDALRVGMALAAFGARWYADRIFGDKRPRRMTEVYSREGLELFASLIAPGETPAGIEPLPSEAGLARALRLETAPRRTPSEARGPASGPTARGAARAGAAGPTS